MLAERAVVEQDAVTRAIAWCKNEGWPIVDDVSSRKAWGLEARTSKGEPPHFVEVKGTTGLKPVIGVTVAEVNHALASPATTVLVVVTDIKLDRLGVARASGGHPSSLESMESAAFGAQGSHVQLVAGVAL